MVPLAEKFNADLVRSVYKYDQWLKEEVVPRWIESGFSENGAAIERFLENGEPDTNANKRIRVQARQMFFLSYAQHQGWISTGPALVQKIESFLTDKTDSLIPGFYPHALDATDTVILPHRDLYDCAFFLLAYGWRYHVFNDLNALHNAEKLISQIELQLKGLKSGWDEDTLESNIRRQNPHMHLFEAFLTLYQFTRDGRWLAYAGEMFSLFENVFFDADNNVVREYFDADWKLNACKGHIVEPGHMMEWIWLLMQYHKFTKKPVLHYCTALYKQAVRIGVDDDACVLFDEVSPTGEILKATKRCWPMTEWVKASLALSKSGDKSFDYESHAAWAIDVLLTKYRNSKHPELYIDQLGSDNRPLESQAPASTLYHLLMAHSEALSYVG